MAQRLGFFERYLTLWVAASMVAGVALGKLVPSLVQALCSACNRTRHWFSFQTA